MEKYLLVAAGGAAGSVARYSLGIQAMRWFGPGWPYGTFMANILGGLMMGLLVGFLAHRGGPDQERLRVLLAVGVLGGFTTFSSYSLETALMIERRAYGAAAGYAAGSVVLAISALFLGLMVARRVFA
ncbi:fluoride efflux transporter CrcB [Phenylobacterium aquaticum]|uniref:fluoride efflux transporter CrcB n=1 Tax=Phenylobacterium aquaticum TaxID=1763816 RepID=UPI001F5D84D5|nr:fluoride efflux transporter CrcB [Phenylobacterium aquaticum]MCI3131386.1 fluoride efflux transporter CrcB [Phenylobacterium aquaticum]